MKAHSFNNSEVLLLALARGETDADLQALCRQLSEAQDLGEERGMRGLRRDLEELQSPGSAVGWSRAVPEIGTVLERVSVYVCAKVGVSD